MGSRSHIPRHGKPRNVRKIRKHGAHAPRVAPNSRDPTRRVVAEKVEGELPGDQGSCIYRASVAAGSSRSAQVTRGRGLEVPKEIPKAFAPQKGRKEGKPRTPRAEFRKIN